LHRAGAVASLGVLMSLRALNTVWEAPIKPASLKLVALALADWSNDEGGSLHPSMSAIAKKTGISRCQAQRLVKEMKSAGVLSVVANKFGGDPGATPHYLLHLDLIQGWWGSTGATGSAGDTGSAHALGGVAPMHKRGSTGATQTTMNRQYEPSGSANAGSSAESASPMTAKEQVWALGPALLGEKSRSVLGKLVATYGEDLVAGVLADCAKEQPGEPKSWVIASCASRKERPKSAHSATNGGAPIPAPAWVISAGFQNVFEAESAGCNERNHKSFQNGRKAAA
jgi:hypothetical protein